MPLMMKLVFAPLCGKLQLQFNSVLRIKRNLRSHTYIFLAQYGCSEVTMPIGHKDFVMPTLELLSQNRGNVK